MKKIIIFDFNRTIFDPETGKLMFGTKIVLRTLKTKGFDLFLVSHGTFPKFLLDSFGIGKYFSEIVFSKQKSEEDFKKILVNKKVDLDSSFVIGDRVRGEIAIGNVLGFRSIWLRQGKFADESPRNLKEKPDFVVKDIKAILEIAQ